MNLTEDRLQIITLIHKNCAKSENREKEANLFSLLDVLAWSYRSPTFIFNAFSSEIKIKS